MTLLPAVHSPRTRQPAVWLWTALAASVSAVAALHEGSVPAAGVSAAVAGVAALAGLLQSDETERSVDKPDIVGIPEVAEIADVQVETVRRWRTRDLLPEPEWMISGVPIWQRATIVAWLEQTGRLPA